MDVEQKEESQRGDRNPSIVGLILGQLSVLAVAISFELLAIVSDMIVVTVSAIIRVVLGWWFRYFFYFFIIRFLEF